MLLPRFTVLYDEWQSKDDAFITPPLSAKREDQLLVFGQRIKNGSLAADFTPESGGRGLQGDDKKDLSFVFRYTDSNHGYMAGIGGYASKYYIARMEPGNWQILALSGESGSLRYGATYSLRVEFTGNKITLYENGVPHLSVTDEKYRSGYWGLRARKTTGRFERLVVTSVLPRCFVVMPFTSELAFVYDVIKKIVETNQMTCIRADDVFVSRPAIDQIRSEIAQADLIIVDFTGKNPNVYYEAGLADAWQKQWIVLAQSPNDLTFDVQHVRAIFYSDRMGADKRLEDDLQSAIRDTIGTASATEEIDPHPSSTRST